MQKTFKLSRPRQNVSLFKKKFQLCLGFSLVSSLIYMISFGLVVLDSIVLFRVGYNLYLNEELLKCIRTRSKKWPRNWAYCPGFTERINCMSFVNRMVLISSRTCLVNLDSLEILIREKNRSKLCFWLLFKFKFRTSFVQIRAVKTSIIAWCTFLTWIKHGVSVDVARPDDNLPLETLLIALFPIEKRLLTIFNS